MSVFSSKKIDRYEYLTVEEILTSDKSKIIEQVKFTYSTLENIFEKKNYWSSRNKTSWSFKSCRIRNKSGIRINWRLFPKKIKNIEIINKIDDIKIGKKKLIEKT